jgi:hypothetical protein
MAHQAPRTSRCTGPCPKEIVAHAGLAAAFTQAPWSVAIHLCQSYEEPDRCR